MNIILLSALTYLSLDANTVAESSISIRVNSLGSTDLSCAIVPDVVDQVESYYDITICYNSSGVTVDSCKELDLTQTLVEPEVLYCADPSCLYSLAMVDPDAIPQPILHWLVVNIPGYNVKKGDVLAEYLNPLPPPGSGLHRYTSLLFKQSKKVQVEPVANREGFSIKEYARKHHLIGKPKVNVYLEQFSMLI